MELPPNPKGELNGQEPNIQEQLLEACLDVRLAIRAQVKKAAKMHRSRRKQDLAMLGVTEEGVPTEVRPTTSDAEIRARLKQTHRVARGTGRQEDRLVRHYLGVYEEESSAMQPDGALYAQLVVTHVTRLSQYEEIEQSQYTINIAGDTVSVSEGARLLSDEELAVPLDIIRDARGLYV